MRLTNLSDGHGFATKIVFSILRTATRQPVPDMIKVFDYRPDFFGTPMRSIAHRALRGPSAWSVADRELMAAFVSNVNACDY